MKPYRQWFEERYGAYPGVINEPLDVVFRRMADSFAEYVEAVAVEIATKSLKAD